MKTEEFWRDRLRDFFEPNQILVAKRPSLELQAPSYVTQKLRLTKEITDALRFHAQIYNRDLLV